MQNDEIEDKRQRAVAAKDSRDHEQAHRLLLKFFPNIPEGACTEILEHGFQKGSGRVGRSRKLEDRLKVQLAVNAHIRHRLTPYDSILASNKGHDAKLTARETVYDQVQAIAESWRGCVSRGRDSRPRTLVSGDSAATLEANRQRRIRVNDAKVTALGEALSGMRLDEREVALQMDAAQRRAQKKAQKIARRVHSGDKQKKEKAARLDRVQQERPRKGKNPPKTYKLSN